MLLQSSKHACARGGGARRGVRPLCRARNLRRRRRQPPGPQSVLEPAPGRQLEVERAPLARPGSVSRRRRLPLSPRGTGSGGGLSRPVRAAASSRQGRAFGSRRLRSRQASPTGAGGGMGAFPVCRSGWRGPPWAGEPWARAAGESQGTVGVRAGPGSPWGAGREGTGCQTLLPLAGGRAPPGALGGSPVNHGAPVAPATGGGAGQDRARGLAEPPGPLRLYGRGSRPDPCPALPCSVLPWGGLAHAGVCGPCLPAWGGGGRPLSGPLLGSLWVSRGLCFHYLLTLPVSPTPSFPRLRAWAFMGLVWRLFLFVFIVFLFPKSVRSSCLEAAVWQKC